MKFVEGLRLWWLSCFCLLDWRSKKKDVGCNKAQGTTFVCLQLHFTLLHTMNTTERTLFFADSEHSPCLLRYQAFFFCRQRGSYYWSHLISYQISTKLAVSLIHVFRCRSLFERLSTPHSMRKCQLILKSSWWVKRSSICILLYCLFPFTFFLIIFALALFSYVCSFIFLLFKCRLGNIRVHTRLVYLSYQPLDLKTRYRYVLPLNFLSSFILDIQGAAREVWPWEGSRYPNHWGHFPSLHFLSLSYFILFHPFCLQLIYISFPPSLSFFTPLYWIYF